MKFLVLIFYYFLQAQTYKFNKTLHLISGSNENEKIIEVLKQ